VSFKYDCLSTFSSFVLLLRSSSSPHLCQSSSDPSTHHSISLISTTTIITTSFIITTTRPGLHRGFILLLIGTDGPQLQSPCRVQAPKTLSRLYNHMMKSNSFATICEAKAYVIIFAAICTCVKVTINRIGPDRGARWSWQSNQQLSWYFKMSGDRSVQ